MAKSIARIAWACALSPGRFHTLARAGSTGGLENQVDCGGGDRMAGPTSSPNSGQDLTRPAAS